MYGIEYYSKVNLLNEASATIPQLPNTVSREAPPPSKSAMDLSDSLALTDQLAFKLQHLSKCPEHLIPKPIYTNSSVITTPVPNNQASTAQFASNSLQNSINSAKSTLSSKYYTDDFILLSEFSEIEGPRPLLTIPTDGGTAFNKNEYSLHLMCVDFHSHIQPSPAPTNDTPSDTLCDEPQTTLSKFSLSKDTSIINYWDSSTSVAACVHHFTLYDIEARGFVRPFCLAYVSYDATKPVVFFEKIRDKFSEITDLLKRSNLNLFKRELDQRCVDLKFTREIFLNWSKSTTDQRVKISKNCGLDMQTCARMTSSSESEASTIMQLKAIDNLRSELECVAEVVTKCLKEKNWTIKNRHESSVELESIGNVGSGEGRSKTMSSGVESVGESKFERAMTFPMDKSNGLFKEDVKQSRIRIQAKLFKNILIGACSQISVSSEQDLNVQSGGIDFHHLNQSETMREHKTMKRLHHLSKHTARQAINEMHLMRVYFSTPHYLLKFRDILDQHSHHYHQNQQQNKHLDGINHFWSITTGSCVIDDFSTSIDTVSLNKYSFLKRTSLTSGSQLTTNYSQILPEFDEQKLKLMTSSIDGQREAPKNASNTSGQTQYFSPLKEETTTSTLDNINNHTETFSNDYSHASAAITTWENLENLFYDAIDTMAVEEDDQELYASTSECGGDECTPEQDLQSTNNKENEYDFVNSLLDYKKAKNTPLNMYLTSSFSFTSPVDVYAAFNKCRPQPSLTDSILHMIEFNFEEVLLNLTTNYSAIFPHLLYSVLKGRPVVCIARYSEDLIYLKSVVDLLSQYVPNSFHNLNDLIASVTPQGCGDNSVPKYTSSPCHLKPEVDKSRQQSAMKHQLRVISERQPIKLNDLKYCKLFGLSLLMANKDNKFNSASAKNKNPQSHFHEPKDDTDLMLKYIPITIRNYISIFDLDKGTFLGPRYDGQHLINAVARCKNLKQDSICHLFLMSRVVKFYVRTAFIYNYSILFDDYFEDGSRLRGNSINTPVSSRTTRTNSVTSFDTKRERIMRYFSVNNTNSPVLNILNVKEPNGFSFLRSRQNSETTSLSSLASSFISINDAEFQKGPVGLFNRRGSRPSVVTTAKTTNEDLELLKIVLTVIGQTTLGADVSGGKIAKAMFSQSDFNIVTNLLRTLSVKQIYLFKLAMRCKKWKEEKKSQNKKPDKVLSEEIPVPLVLDYEEVSLMKMKR